MRSPSLLAVLLAACPSAGPGSETAAPIVPTVAPDPSAPPPRQQAAPIPSALCAPVSACNAFFGCALARPAPAPGVVGAHVVEQYDHNPSRVGSNFSHGTVCWPPTATDDCVEVLIDPGQICTPVPPDHIRLEFSCVQRDGRCTAVER